MFAKSFLALDGNGGLNGARTAQISPYDSDTCHLCGCALQCHLSTTTNARGSNTPKRVSPAMVDSIVPIPIRMPVNSNWSDGCSASSPMPLPGSVKPTGNAHNARTVTMVNVTA